MFTTYHIISPYNRSIESCQKLLVLNTDKRRFVLPALLHNYCTVLHYFFLFRIRYCSCSIFCIYRTESHTPLLFLLPCYFSSNFCSSVRACRTLFCISISIAQPFIISQFEQS